MDQYVEAQHRHDAGSVNLGRRIVSDRRNIDDTVKQARSAQQLIECFKGGRPTANRIALRALWFGRERPEKEYVMEADYVLQDSPGVPLSAWRLGLPVITHSTDPVAEGSTDLPVPVRRVA